MKISLIYKVLFGLEMIHMHILRALFKLAIVKVFYIEAWTVTMMLNMTDDEV